MKYQDIFNLYLAAPARKLKLGPRWIFQQDNDQNNLSKSTQKWITEDKIKLLPWPYLSPDQILWAELKRRVNKREPRMIWRDSLKRNGFRFLSLYSPTILDVMGEDFLLCNW